VQVSKKPEGQRGKGKDGPLRQLHQPEVAGFGDSGIPQGVAHEQGEQPCQEKECEGFVDGRGAPLKIAPANALYEPEATEQRHEQGGSIKSHCRAGRNLERHDEGSGN